MHLPSSTFACKCVTYIVYSFLFLKVNCSSGPSNFSVDLYIWTMLSVRISVVGWVWSGWMFGLLKFLGYELQSPNNYFHAVLRDLDCVIYHSWLHGKHGNIYHHSNRKLWSEWHQCYHGECYWALDSNQFYLQCQVRTCITCAAKSIPKLALL